MQQSSQRSAWLFWLAIATFCSPFAEIELPHAQGVENSTSYVSDMGNAPPRGVMFPGPARTDPNSRSSAQMEGHQPRPSQHAKEKRQSPAGNQYLPPPPVPPEPSIVAEFGPQPAAEPAAFSLAALEQMACQNNPTLLQARAQVQGALGEAIQAGLWPNPTAVYIGEQIGVNGTPGEFQGGVIRQEIVTGRKLDLSRAKFRARTQVAEWNALAQQYRVLNDVRIHYFRARGMQDLLHVRNELLKNAEDNLVTVQEMYNQGQATRAEIHHANVDLQQHRLEVLMTQNDFLQAALQTPLEADMTPFSWEQALTRILEESPQMQAARSKLEADRITVKREIVEPIPNLLVEAGAGQNFEAGQTTAMASLAIEVPIFDWNQGTIRQAEADYARQQGELRRTELQLRRELGQRYRDYLTALQHVVNYQQVILPESRKEYELQLESYKEDRLAWPVVLQSERNYFMLRVVYVRNLTAWREAEVLIVGFLLHDGLMPATEPAPAGHINAVPKPR
jgi:outer membrane protein, heavy metal efflux system